MFTVGAVSPRRFVAYETIPDSSYTPAPTGGLCRWLRPATRPTLSKDLQQKVVHGHAGLLVQRVTAGPTGRLTLAAWLGRPLVRRNRIVRPIVILVDGSAASIDGASLLLRYERLHRPAVRRTVQIVPALQRGLGARPEIVPALVAAIAGRSVTVPGDDAFFLTLYRDEPTSMACRWYNMPAYANTINGQFPSTGGRLNSYNGGANGAGGLSYLAGLASMLTRLYPDASIPVPGGASQTRPRVIVRVDQTGPAGNGNPAQGVAGGTTNRELDYAYPDYYDTGYYYDDGDGYAYDDDYSGTTYDGNTYTYYDMPAAPYVRQAGNVLQGWYASPAPTVDPCSVCLLNRWMG
uniref:Uncharacterized protein n=1 Tax=Anopheles melas TaxID=34690 RepID=A0A182TIH7_9DIPT